MPQSREVIRQVLDATGAACVRSPDEAMLAAARLSAAQRRSRPDSGPEHPQADIEV